MAYIQSLKCFLNPKKKQVSGSNVMFENISLLLFKINDTFAA